MPNLSQKSLDKLGDKYLNPRDYFIDGAAPALESVFFQVSLALREFVDRFDDVCVQLGEFKSPSLGKELCGAMDDAFTLRDKLGRILLERDKRIDRINNRSRSKPGR